MVRSGSTVPDGRRAPAGVTVVMITRDRCDHLGATLERLVTLPSRPPVVVVDNGSTDATVPLVRRAFPEVQVIPLGRNAGAAGRTIGVRAARSPYVAFSDDDSWWEPGALPAAVTRFERHPRLGVLAGRVLVGADRRLDPTCAAMASSPLGRSPELPGPAVLGFVACGAVVRRSAYLAVGGFDPRFDVGGEETPLAVDLAAAGWDVAYVDDVVAVHEPSPVRDPERRRRRTERNRLYLAWSRRRLGPALRATGSSVARAGRDPVVRAAVAEAVRNAVSVLGERRPLPRELDRRLAQLDAA